MFLDNDREQMHQFYATAWQKSQNNQPLEPIEQQIADIIRRHPEYHGYFTDAERTLNVATDDGISENPFLHVALHLAIIEQLSINQPQGIRDIFQQLAQQLANPHEAEHQIMFILAKYLAKMANKNNEFDSDGYLQAIKQLLKQT